MRRLWDYDDFLEIIVRDNVNHRTYESRDIEHDSKRNDDGTYTPQIRVRSWNEIKANGDTIKHVFPEILPSHSYFTSVKETLETAAGA